MCNVVSPGRRLTYSTVNLVPFGLDITELRMHGNRYFVVPVNILTPFVSTSFFFGCMTYHVS